MKCRNCGTRLSEGKDAFQLQEGVMGYQRFVPLADPFYFWGLSRSPLKFGSGPLTYNLTQTVPPKQLNDRAPREVSASIDDLAGVGISSVPPGASFRPSGQPCPRASSV